MTKVPEGMKIVESVETRFLKVSEKKFKTHEEARVYADARRKVLNDSEVRLRIRSRQDGYSVIEKCAKQVKVQNFVPVLDENIPRIPKSI